MRTRFTWDLCKIALFLVVLFLGRKQVIAQESTLDTKELSKKYAVILAAQGVIEELKDKKIPGLVSSCCNDILDPKKIKLHKNRGDSEKHTQKYVKKKLKSALKEDLDVLYQSFKIDKKKFSRQEFVEEVRNKFRSQIDDNISRNLNQNFQEIFKQARKKAISKQLDELSRTVYPDEKEIAEFEDAYIGGWKKIDTNRLKTKLRLKIKREERCLLEEVYKLREKISEEVLNDIYTQMDIQENAIEGELPDELLTQNQLQQGIRRNVNAAITRERKKSRMKIIAFEMKYKGEKIPVSKEVKRKIYNIFSFVKKKIVEKAKIEEKERFRKFCRNIDSIAIGSQQELEEIIRADLATHKMKDKSKDIIVDKFLSKVKKRILEQYVAKAPVKEQSGFKKRLARYLGLPDIQEDIKQRCKELVENDLEIVRDKISDEQLRRYFPKLADNSWEVPKLAKKEHKHKKDIMKSIKGHSKHPLSITSFDDCIDEPIGNEISEGGWNRNELLQETEEKVKDQTEFLIDEAGRAWEGQWKIYLAHQEYIQENPKKRIFLKDEIKGNLDKSKEDWVRYFTDKIKKIWSKNREALIWQGNVPTYGKNKYLPLYDHIEKEIEQRLNTNVGTILASIDRSRREHGVVKREAKEGSGQSGLPTDSEVPKVVAPEGSGLPITKAHLKIDWLKLLLLFLILIALIVALTYIGTTSGNIATLAGIILVVLIFVAVLATQKDKLFKITTEIEKKTVILEPIHVEDGYLYTWDKYKLIVKTKGGEPPEKVIIATITK